MRRIGPMILCDTQMAINMNVGTRTSRLIAAMNAATGIISRAKPLLSAPRERSDVRKK